MNAVDYYNYTIDHVIFGVQNRLFLPGDCTVAFFVGLHRFDAERRAYSKGDLCKMTKSGALRVTHNEGKRRQIPRGVNCAELPEFNK